MRKLSEILEALVIIVIVGALAHTFLEDYAGIAGWKVPARSALIWAGLAFDLFFTIEFFARLYVALESRRAMAYLFRERGWIDFMASIPLLLLNSAPHALALLAGAGLLSGAGSFLNTLKVIKAIRIARILRLLRVIKLFRGIRYAQSPMAQRHLSTITTIAVSILVFWLIGASVLESTGTLPGLEAPSREGQFLRARAIAAGGTAGLAERAAAAGALDTSILVVRAPGGATAWTRYPPAYYDDNFMSGDYGYLAIGGVEVFLDQRLLSAATAREGLVFFVAVVLTVLGFIFLYAPRFALGISDPIHVMRRGLSEPGYNLEVRIPEENAGEDVFELAALYNGVYLPLKDRESAEPGETGLRIESLADLVKDE
jgi:hypothetical protein